MHERRATCAHVLRPPWLRQYNPSGRFSLSSSGKSRFNSRHPVPEEGALAIVTNVGMGCGGRGGVVRARGWQGELSGLVSDPRTCRRAAPKRTVKSCGPDASLRHNRMSRKGASDPLPDIALIASASLYRPCHLWLLTLKHKFTSFGNFALVSSPYRSRQR